MRRNAVTLVACLAIPFILIGCRSLEHKQSKPTAGLAASALYAQPAGDYTGYSAEATSTEPAGLDSTYVSDAPAYGTSVAEASRRHTVVKNDTLFGLARLYYNDASRWKDIYAANRSEIGDPNKIGVGQELLIP